MQFANRQSTREDYALHHTQQSVMGIMVLVFSSVSCVIVSLFSIHFACNLFVSLFDLTALQAPLRHPAHVRNLRWDALPTPTQDDSPQQLLGLFFGVCAG